MVSSSSPPVTRRSCRDVCVVAASQNGASDGEVVRQRNDCIGAAGAALLAASRQSMEVRVLDFLRYNGALLPMYFTPGPNLRK